VTNLLRPAALLGHALGEDPSRPLLTFYDDATGERTELSVATFANWVAKTANLLRDDLDLQPGAAVEVDLPLHWQSVVWLHACWATGLVVHLPGDGPDRAAAPDLAVVTHARADSDAAEVVSLGLGPMGLARPGQVPAYAGALDYDREVHGHGDRFSPAGGRAGTDPALVAGPTTYSGDDLTAAASEGPAFPPGSRLLVTTPLDTAAAAVAAGLVPLATPVTVVLCRHLDPARLTGRATQENLVASLTGASGAVPVWGPLPGP
jgi:uncharacterized protein (TIGR03089 family)